MEEERYWLQVDGQPWREASRTEFINAERRAGFRPKGGGQNDLATGGFSSSGSHTSSIAGRITIGDIDLTAYQHDPEFVEAVIKADA